MDPGRNGGAGSGVGGLFCEDLVGEEEGVVDAAAEGVGAELFGEAAGGEGLHGLGLDGGEEDADAVVLHFADRYFEGVEGAGVDGRDVAEAEDDDFGATGVGAEDALEFGDHGEEEGTLEAEEDHAGGDLLAAQGEGAVVFGIVIGGEEADVGDVLHAFDKQDDADEEADGDADGEVEEDGEGEGGEEGGEVGMGAAPGFAEGAPLGHAEGDAHEDGGEAGEGDVFGEGGGDEDEEEEGGGMDESGDGGACSAADVGGGAGDGSGGGEASHERDDEVGEALTDEFGVRVVAGIGHAVRDGGGEEAFNGPECGDGEGGAHEGAEVGEGEGGEVPAGEGGGQFAELAADGFDRPVQEGDEDGGDGNRDDGGGDATGEFGQEEDDEESDGSGEGGGPVDVGEVADGLQKDFRGVLFSSETETEQGGDLPQKNDHGDAAGESGDDGEGDVAEEGAEFEEAGEDEHEAGQHGGEGEAGETVDGHHAGENGDEGTGGAADLEF